MAISGNAERAENSGENARIWESSLRILTQSQTVQKKRSNSLGILKESSWRVKQQVI